MTSSANPILRVDGLVKHFDQRAGFFSGGKPPIKAVDGVTFQIERGRTLGLVGESGSGKTTTGRLIMRLLDPTRGTIEFDGTDITSMSRRDLRATRRRMQIVLQNPFGSLDPRMKVGQIVVEPLRYNTDLTGSERRQRVLETLEIVGLNPDHATRYPHEFSGGQRQRIGIARALIVRPDLLVLDEPVSALDVSIQAQIVNLLQDLQEEFGLTYLLIAHDLSVVRQICDRVAVMYLGKIVELGTRQQIYATPSHPYTQALLSAVPISNPDLRGTGKKIVLAGDIPSPSRKPPGCDFSTRCFKAEDMCRVEEPQLIEHFSTGQLSACHFAEQLETT